jgi:hypothetical protein
MTKIVNTSALKMEFETKRDFGIRFLGLFNSINKELDLVEKGFSDLYLKDLNDEWDRRINNLRIALYSKKLFDEYNKIGSMESDGVYILDEVLEICKKVDK